MEVTVPAYTGCCELLDDIASSLLLHLAYAVASGPLRQCQNIPYIIMCPITGAIAAAAGMRAQPTHALSHNNQMFVTAYM